MCRRRMPIPQTNEDGGKDFEDRADPACSSKTSSTTRNEGTATRGNATGSTTKYARKKRELQGLQEQADSSLQLQRKLLLENTRLKSLKEAADRIVEGYSALALGMAVSHTQTQTAGASPFLHLPQQLSSSFPHEQLLSGRDQAGSQMDANALFLLSMIANAGVPPSLGVLPPNAGLSTTNLSPPETNQHNMSSSHPMIPTTNYNTHYSTSRGDSSDQDPLPPVLQIEFRQRNRGDDLEDTKPNAKRQKH